ncbi:hypothetical protein AVEN_20626-1 [Araneus ventricosus]|uniref:Uncharacterized protein n=1 Tax=Araneus ventricosus TaxID=182803 RepID=A0A4Y2UK38_ARAVE|nr:hypothetical protein AVEN_20626-1 [Araneus ventricosus]
MNVGCFLEPPSRTSWDDVSSQLKQWVKLSFLQKSILESTANRMLRAGQPNQLTLGKRPFVIGAARGDRGEYHTELPRPGTIHRGMIE